MELYHDSLLTKFHYDENGNPVAVDCRETQVVTNKAMVQLAEFPDSYHRVTVTKEDGSRLAETLNPQALENHQFYVNYNNGIVYVHTDLIGKALTFAYRGRGVELLSTNRIFHKYNQDSECIVETLSEIVDNFIEEVDEVIERGEEAERQLIETNERINEQEEIRKENEENRNQVFTEQMERIEQEIFDKDSKFQTQLAEQQETFEEAMNDWNGEFDGFIQENTVELNEAISNIYETNSRLNQNEQNRQDVFNHKLQEVEDKILSNEAEFNTQKDKFDESFAEKLEEFDGRFEQKTDEQQLSFEEKLREWEQIVSSLGVINDNAVSPYSTWSSDKISKLGEASSLPNTIVKRSMSGDIYADKIFLGNDGGFLGYGTLNEWDIDGLYTQVGKSFVQVLTDENASVNASQMKVAKRDMNGGLMATKFSVQDLDGAEKGEFSVDRYNKPIFSRDGIEKQILLTNHDVKNVERGTWTPRPKVENGAEIVSDAVGHYFVIGTMAVITGRFSWTSLPADTNGRLIIPLPFICRGNATTGNIGIRNGLGIPSDAYDVICEVPSSTNELRFYCVKSGKTGANYHVSNLATSGEIHFSVVILIPDEIMVG